MISIMSLLLILFVTLMIYILYKSKGNLPPGPKGLPIIGNLHQIDRQMFLTIAKWSKQYNGIYKMKLGGKSVIIVNDYKMVKEMFSNESAFTGRLDMKAFDMIDNGIQHGIVNTEGETWEQLRRFTLRQLRDFGFGKNSMESYIMDEVNELHDWVKSQEKKPIKDLKGKFTLGVINSLWTIITGHRYSQDDPKLNRLTHSLNSAINDVADNGSILLFAPWLRYIIPGWSGYTKYREAVKEFSSFFIDAVEEHKKSYDDEFTKDFIDVFLKEINKTTDPSSPFFGQVGEDQLLGSIFDLFSAGFDTTSTTLSWAVLYLVKFPEVQKKLQKEIEIITGNSRPCSLTDRPSMPYAKAVLAEILRYSSLVPNGVPHRAIIDKDFKGYLIPKGSIIMADLYFIHRDPKIWGDPENFKPERFLSLDGKIFKKHEALIPFLIGRRQCLGETLARDTLFLFMTNVFQKFNVKVNPLKPDLNLDPGIGFLLHPKPFEVIMEERLS